MKRGFLILLVLTVLLFVPIRDLMAHRVGVHAVLNGTTIEGEGNFGKGRPCIDCGVIILDEKGAEISRGKTDSSGRFRIGLQEAPSTGTLKVVLEGGPGHRGEWEIALGNTIDNKSGKEQGLELTKATLQSQGQVPSREGPNANELRAMVREELQRAIGPLQNEIMGLRETGTGFREVVGGIGYIVGIAGLIMYLRAGRKNS